MRSFSKLIRAGERLHEFNFRQLSGIEKKYHVDVPDGRGNRIVFYMLRDDKDGWKINDQLPTWIVEVEKELSEAIEQQELEMTKTGRRS